MYSHLVPTKEQKDLILRMPPNSEKFEALELQEKAWYVYWRGFYDIEFFVNYHFKHYKTDKKTGEPIQDSPLHTKLRQNLLSDHDLVIVFPRDHAKSTNSFFVIMWQIVYKVEKHIALLMSE